MNDRQDSQLETLLREHFASKLDAQLGRSAERFMSEFAAAPRLRLTDAPFPRSHRRLRLFGWTAGVAGAAVAAGIAAVMILAPLLTQPAGLVSPTVNQIARGHSDTTGGAGDVTNVAAAAPVDVEHALTWNTVDQGTVYLSGDVPVRSVVRQANETMRWYDPQRKAHVEMTVPRDEVMLVGYQSQ